MLPFERAIHEEYAMNHQEQ